MCFDLWSSLIGKLEWHFLPGKVLAHDLWKFVEASPVDSCFGSTFENQENNPNFKETQENLA